MLTESERWLFWLEFSAIKLRLKLGWRHVSVLRKASGWFENGGWTASRFQVCINLIEIADFLFEL
jgi:hypothetical protein